MAEKFGTDEKVLFFFLRGTSCFPRFPHAARTILVTEKPTAMALQPLCVYTYSRLFRAHTRTICVTHTHTHTHTHGAKRYIHVADTFRMTFIFFHRP